MFLLLILLNFPAFANLTTSALTGRVTVGDAPLPGVTVTASSTSLQRPRTTITSAHGTYFLDALPPGVYEVTFSLAGHTSLTRKAIVEYARVARADAKLERSEDEESVTSTARTPSVVDTTTITTHLDDKTLDLLPVRRNPFSLHRVDAAPVDDLFYDPSSLGEETIEQITVLRGAIPAEHDRPLIATRTRSGSEKLGLSLRDTITNTDWIDDRYRAFAQEQGTKHRLELAAGGRIMPERLWFFAGGWIGDEVDVVRNDQRGVLAKLTASPAAAHSIEATYIDVDANFAGLADDSTSAMSLRYAGIAGARSVTQAMLSRAEDVDGIAVRSSYVLGNHVLAGGASRSDDFSTIFAADRWAAARWTIYAGMRHNDRATLPRAAVTYDLRGNARHALHASYADYDVGLRVRETSLGYALALGTGGDIRVDVLQRKQESREIYIAVLDGRYRAFDRLIAGGNYAYMRDTFATQHRGHGWAGVELPIGEHTLALTLLQHIISNHDTVAPTDFAVRYAIPFPNFGMTVAADVTNVAGTDPARAETPRSLRFWVRLAL